MQGGLCCVKVNLCFVFLPLILSFLFCFAFQGAPGAAGPAGSRGTKGLRVRSIHVFFFFLALLGLSHLKFVYKKGDASSKFLLPLQNGKMFLYFLPDILNTFKFFEPHL